MIRARVLLSLALVVLVAGGSLFGDDKGTTKVKGRLPTGWTKLGLSAEQKQKIYSIRSEYQGKIQELEQKLRELRKEELTAMSQILTAAQRSQLRQMALDKVPAETLPTSKGKGK